MQDALFYLFAGLTLVCGSLVVANPFSRNPVTSAMFLVLTIAALAGLFILLEAFFLAVVQIIVYAGAVIVLFLFVIMLLDVKEGARRRFKVVSVVLGTFGVAALVVLLTGAIRSSELQSSAAPVLRGDTALLGRALFTNHLLAFEIVSVLLLVAMVGVVLLSRKDLK